MPDGASPTTGSIRSGAAAAAPGGSLRGGLPDLLALLRAYGGETCRFEEAAAILRLVVEEQRANAARTLCIGFAAGSGAGCRGRWPRRGGFPPSPPPGTSRSPPRSPATSGSSPGRAARRTASAPPAARPACRCCGWRTGSSAPSASAWRCAPAPRTSSTPPASITTPAAERPRTPPGGGRLPRRRAGPRQAPARGGRGAKLSKYNVGAAPMPALPKGARVVLVAGQVENDASIKLCGATVARNVDLLKLARQRHPDAVIAFKPHPDVEAGLGRAGCRRRKSRPCGHRPARRVGGRRHRRRRPCRDHLVADRVRGAAARPERHHPRPAVLRGLGPDESPACPRRTRRITLDELVAASLIVYRITSIRAAACPVRRR